MKILLIEDDLLIRDVIKRGLEKEHHYNVETAADGRTGLRLALENDYALIILDIMLPQLDGWRVCEEIRLHRIPTPILMLTARDQIPERIHGLNLGADDYMTKPFDFGELLARMRALLRRDKFYKARVLQIAHLEIDTGTRVVRCDGVEVAMTQREYALLETLAMNEGHIVSRDTIQYQIWNSDDSTSNTVDVYIGMLRKKIDADRPTKLIHTIHGLGYMLKDSGKEAII